MNKEKIEEGLIDILGSVLKTAINKETTRFNNEDWDSLNHMEIIFSIEEKFGVQFTEEEIGQMDSFASLSLYLNRSHEK
jgi:acyl carrier protein